MMAITLSASLVLYKPDLATVERTLHGLQMAGKFAMASIPLRLNLTLVDNSDDDGVYEQIFTWCEGIRPKLPDWQLHLQRAPGNLGYGRGNNLAIEGVQSDYHLVINPDLFVREGSLLEALRYMEASPEVGLLTPAVFGEDGERQYLCKRNPTLFIMFLRSVAPDWTKRVFQPVLHAFEMRDCNYEREIHPVEYPTGCFMFFRTARLKEIGGFDPQIFLHYEDADIGRRMLAIACVNYVPSVVVTHKWQRDTHKSLGGMLLTARSGWYYWRKWGGIFFTSPMREPSLVLGDTKSVSIEGRDIGQGRRVLVTGANGFIGRAVCRYLPCHGFNVLGVVRKSIKDDESDGKLQYKEIDNLDEQTDWSSVLRGIDSVVHLAARVHVMEDVSTDSLSEYRRTNVDLTMNLARQAAACGVRRFVYISSIKVNGESTPVGQPFTSDDVPRPEDNYAISKLEAENALLDLAKTTSMEVVIVRPPLVYGPGVKANFETMMRWINKGIPLPLGALDNRRSLVAIDNLSDFIMACLHHKNAPGQIFLVSDNSDLTISELLAAISRSLRSGTILVPVPKIVLRGMAGILNKHLYARRLLSLLQIDMRKNVHLLGWTPPVCPDHALKETCGSQSIQIQV